MVSRNLGGNNTATLPTFNPQKAKDRFNMEPHAGDKQAPTIPASTLEESSNTMLAATPNSQPTI